MTLDEIKKAVETNPTLQKEIAVWASATTEGKELLTNFSKLEVEKAIKDKTAEIYTNIDNDIFGILGERKANDQKTYDFLKKIAEQYKELKDKADKLNDNDKIKELEAKIKEFENKGEINDYWKDIHNKAAEKWEQEKKEIEGKLLEKEKEFFEATIVADLKTGLASLKIKEGMPQEAVDALIEVEKAKILKGAKIVEGKPTYYNEDGSPITNNEHKPATPKEIWQERLKGLIDTGDGTTGNAGGGAKPTIEGGKVVKTGEGDSTKFQLKLNKGEFSTKVEFHNLATKALKEGGLIVGSKEYKQALDDAYAEYEVGKMPRE